MEYPLIKQEIFDNGVTLRLYDASRKLAGDRWLVAIVAKAIVPVREELFHGEAVNTDDLIKIKQALADEVVFEQKRERYFIDEQEKDIVLKELMESFLSMTKVYIAHPEFPARFVKKCFREYLAKKRLNHQMNNRS